MKGLQSVWLLARV